MKGAKGATANSQSGGIQLSAGCLDSRISPRRSGAPWEKQVPVSSNAETPRHLHKVTTKLELREFALVGFSTGGEVARHLRKYGSKGVSGD